MSSCVWNLRVFPDDARGCQCPFVLCLHPHYLRIGVWASRSYQERIGKSRSFGMWHHHRGYVSNFLVRQPHLRCAGKVGNPLQTKQGNRPSCRDQEGRRGSEKLCLEPRCSHRGRPVCRGTFGLHQVYQVPYQTSRWNVRLLLIRCSRKGLHLAMTGESRGFSRVVAGFSSYYRECRLPLVLAQEIPIFHSSCEGELGIALESLQGKIDLI